MRRRSSKVNPHDFSMAPRPDVPRSSFLVEHTHKTTFDADYLIPIFVDEVLPGDTISLRMSTFTRMGALINPIMDNLFLDSFFFFVPNRILWKYWEDFISGNTVTKNSITPVPPTFNVDPTKHKVGDVLDYMGYISGKQPSVNMSIINAMPVLAYNKVYNDWFRDENFIDPVIDYAEDVTPSLAGGVTWNFDVGATDWALKKRCKKRDYFTSCLPFPQRGPNQDLGHLFKVIADKDEQQYPTFRSRLKGATTDFCMYRKDLTLEGKDRWYNAELFALGTAPVDKPDLNSALRFERSGLNVSFDSGVNELRKAFAIQRALEKDMRSGHRYTEILEGHFGVRSPDARLQRAEYLGGGSSRIEIHSIAQTSATPEEPTKKKAPLGTLGATATIATDHHGFAHSFTEHGFIIGIINVRADITYQQFVHRMWKRNNRWDHYFPAFAHLGEDAVYKDELCQLEKVDPNNRVVFGYQERWAEYRYKPNMITGFLNSNAHLNNVKDIMDNWHVAQKLDPTTVNLSKDFIECQTPMNRVLALGPSTAKRTFIFDSFFKIRKTRCMPLYSVPGYIDRF